MGRIPGWLVNLVFGLAVTLLFYGVVEVLCRWAEDGTKYRPSDLTVYELVPGYDDGGTTINRHGLRGEEFVAEKAAYRILAMGGSTTWGHKLDDDETWPYLLEPLLRERSSEPIEVLNGGVSGWGLEQVERTLLERHLDTLDPDLVVVYSGWNEPTMQWNEMTHTFRTRNVSSEEKHWIFRSAFARWLARWIDHRRRDLGLSRRPREEPVPMPDGRPDHVDSVRANFPSRLGSIAKACEERGVALAVVLYPGLMDLVALPSDPFRESFAEQLTKHSPIDGDLEAQIAGLRQRHTQTLIAVSEAARQHRIRALDVVGRMHLELSSRPKIEQREQWTGYLRDHAHLTAEGNAAIARAIAPLLLEMRSSGVPTTAATGPGD